MAVFSEYARIPSDWIVPLPKGLTLKEAMVFGTAGFTAALSIHRLEENGLTPEKGPVLVTGATGGVGSTAVAMLAKRGYHVVASTGKASEHEYLQAIGAADILSREDFFRLTQFQCSGSKGGQLQLTPSEAKHLLPY
ncbi:hypothetical protein GCM10020331_014850 [Ectobacillus funiculus]